MSQNELNPEILITGLGQISAMGQGIPSLWEGLKQEKKPQTQIRKVMTAAGEKEISVFTTDEVILPSNIPGGVARRMSRLSKMCFASVAEAMDEAFSDIEKDPTRIGLVVGSAFGSLDLANEFNKRINLEGPVGASPSLFASSVQNSIASHLSITFNLQGPSTTVMTMEQTAINSLRIAYDWLHEEVVDHVVVVIGDEISEHHAYFMAHQNRSEQISAKSNECTAILGEGAVCFVLSRSDKVLFKNNYVSISSIHLGQYSALTATKTKYDLFASKNERTFLGMYGRENQWELYQKNLNIDLNSAESHLNLYGSLITGIAFESLIAVLFVKKDSLPTVCIQVTDHKEIQTISFAH